MTRLTELAHLKLKETIRLGDTVIDATAGNGHDTLVMADWVGPGGQVIAIDLQASALESTRARLQSAGCLNRCDLIQGNHATALAALQAQHREQIAAIIFNLGYLPGGPKDIVTQPETTLRALEWAAQLLRPEGILLVTAYRGHAGGLAEADEVEAWMRTRPTELWQVEAREPSTSLTGRIPPILWIARKSQGNFPLAKGDPKAAFEKSTIQTTSS